MRTGSGPIRPGLGESSLLHANTTVTLVVPEPWLILSTNLCDSTHRAYGNIVIVFRKVLHSIWYIPLGAHLFVSLSTSSLKIELIATCKN